MASGLFVAPDLSVELDFPFVVSALEILELHALPLKYDSPLYIGQLLAETRHFESALFESELSSQFRIRERPGCVERAVEETVRTFDDGEPCEQADHGRLFEARVHGQRR